MRSKKLDEAGCITGTHSLVWPDQTHLPSPILILCCNGCRVGLPTGYISRKHLLEMTHIRAGIPHSALTNAELAWIKSSPSSAAEESGLQLGRQLCRIYCTLYIGDALRELQLLSSPTPRVRDSQANILNFIKQCGQEKWKEL